VLFLCCLCFCSFLLLRNLLIISACFGQNVYVTCIIFMYSYIITVVTVQSHIFFFLQFIGKAKSLFVYNICSFIFLSFLFLWIFFYIFLDFQCKYHLHTIGETFIFALLGINTLNFWLHHHIPSFLCLYQLVHLEQWCWCCSKHLWETFVSFETPLSLLQTSIKQILNMLHSAAFTTGKTFNTHNLLDARKITLEWSILQNIWNIFVFYFLYLLHYLNSSNS